MLLGLPHHADQFVQGTFRAALGNANINRTETIQRATKHQIPHALVHGQGLSRQNRLVDRGVAADDFSIGRDALPRQNAQYIPFPDVPGRNPLLPSVCDAPPFLRREADELFQPFLGAFGCFLLDDGPDGHNECHFPRRKQISYPYGCEHGDGNQERGRNLADAGIFEHTEDCQIHEGQAAYHHRYPCGVEGQRVPHPFHPQTDEKGHPSDRRHRHGRKKLTPSLEHSHCLLDKERD